MEKQVKLRYDKTTQKLFYEINNTAKEITNWVELTFKNTPFPVDDIKNNANADISFEEVIDAKGKSKLKILTIRYGGKDYSRVRNNQNPSINFHHIVNEESATAPYNFVPLNEKVIYPEEQTIFFDTYDIENRYSGVLNLNIVTQTHLFIRGFEKEFLKIDNLPIIPGSSLRGLIRSLAEILSYSKMEFVNNSRYYFRSFADKSIRLRETYKNEITKQENVGILYLNNETKDYFLVPSTLQEKVNDISKVDDYTYDDSTSLWTLYSGKMPGKNGKRKNYKILGKNISDENRILVEWDSDVIREYKEDKNRGGLDVLKRLDENELNKIHGVPVFYQSDTDGKIKSFGNTLNYRIPYKYKVHDHLTENHSLTETNTKLLNNEPVTVERLDLANMVFGKVSDNNDLKTIIPSRVYFEDCKCVEPNYSEETSLKVLGGPKPTSFQLYLKQPHGIGTSDKELVNWNDKNSIIRGYKQYWHRITPDDSTNPYSWKEDGIIDDNVHTKPIIPLKPDNTFEGSIRFENLTKIELGMLLTAIDLPKSCFHKIGLGKPLGLGTIKITSELKIDDRRNRYSELLASDGKWNVPIRNKDENSLDSFKNVFAEFILKELRENKTSIWDIPRISELRNILKFDKKTLSSEHWLEETRYLEMNRPVYFNGEPKINERTQKQETKNEFSIRKVLPKPNEIAKNIKD